MSRLKDEFPADMDYFLKFCEATFDFGRASVYRYISWGASLRKNFLTEDGQLPTYVNSIKQNVFKMLGQDIDPTVLEKVKTLAQQGEVTKSDVKDILDGMQQQLSEQSTELLDAKATIANRDAQLDEASRLLAEANARADRNALHERELASAVSTLEGSVQAYQRDLQQQADEIEVLRNRAPETQEVEVEVVPKEFKSKEEMLAAAQARYESTQQQLLATEEQLAQKQAELQKTNEQLEASTATLKTISELQDAVDEITRKFPLEVVTRASSLSPAARATVRACSQSLAALSELLEKAGQENA